jgi:hypothetical protein
MENTSHNNENKYSEFEIFTAKAPAPFHPPPSNQSGQNNRQS